MLKRLIFLLVLIVPFSVVSAQDEAEWSIYLYRSVTREVLEVRADGTTTLYDIGVTGDELVTLDSFAMLENGWAVYCYSDRDQQDLPVYGLRVYDLPNSQVHAEATFGRAFDCDLYDGLSATDEIVAMGVLRYFSNSPGADFSLPVWEVFVVDVAVGEIVESINADVLANVVPVEDMTSAPYILDVNEDRVLFRVRPIGGNQTDVIWNLRTGEATVAEPAESFAIQLERYSQFGEQGFDIRDSIATIRSSDPISVLVNGSQPYNIVGAAAIDNGERLAVQTVTEIASSGMPATQLTYEWTAIDGNGNAESLGVSQLQQIVGIPNGYASLTREQPLGFENIIQTLTVVENGVERELFAWHGETFRSSWTIMRVVPSTFPTGNTPTITVP